jgi:hypothetical protein
MASSGTTKTASETKGSVPPPELPSDDLPQPKGASAGAAGPGGASPKSGNEASIALLEAEVKTRFANILNRQREEFGDVLAITRPRAKLDPLAEAALAKLAKEKVPDQLEKELRDSIVDKGIASEVRKVTSRLNARSMTDGRRWVLATTYVSLLDKLIDGAPEKIEKLFADDLGVAERIMLEIEADGGPLDRFAGLLVKSVMDKNRIKDDETLRKRVSQQVRNAI